MLPPDELLIYHRVPPVGFATGAASGEDGSVGGDTVGGDAEDEEAVLARRTLIFGFSGWMDGGDVSTGTVERLVDLLGAEPLASIDAEPFYIHHVPGSMDVATMFRPAVEIQDGLIENIDMPTNTFYSGDSGPILFLGHEPQLHWESFARAVFAFAERMDVERLLFIGSFGGAVPHTREPRMYATASDEKTLESMLPYAGKRAAYSGPGSFTSFLSTKCAENQITMASLVAEIPGYLQGTNPMCIEAVTRRLSKLLGLELNLAELRNASDEWEDQVSQVVEQDEDLKTKVREMEEAYDNELIGNESE